MDRRAASLERVSGPPSMPWAAGKLTDVAERLVGQDGSQPRVHQRIVVQGHHSGYWRARPHHAGTETSEGVVMNHIRPGLPDGEFERLLGPRMPELVPQRANRGDRVLEGVWPGVGRAIQLRRIKGKQGGAVTS